MNDIFERASFTGEYRSHSEDFYKQFFPTTSEMNDFFQAIFRNDSISTTPRRMMNQLRRFVSLCSEQESSTSKFDALKILYLRMGIESLCVLSNSAMLKRQFFTDYFSPTDQYTLLSNIAIHPETDALYVDHTPSVNISDFSNLFFEIRNQAVHEGNCWDISLFTTDTYPRTFNISIGKVSQTKFSKFKADASNCDFNFIVSSSLQFDVFVQMYMRAGIAFIQSYVENTSDIFQL